MSSVRSVKDLSGPYTRLAGGGGGIRTHETLSGLTVFKTAGFNHSPTPPGSFEFNRLGPLFQLRETPKIQKLGYNKGRCVTEPNARWSFCHIPSY